MAYSNTPTLNSVVLHITNIKPVKAPKTIKQIMGKELTEISIIGLEAQQNVLQIDGRVIGTTSANLDTNRTDLEALDSVTAYDYVDGLHNGTYIVQPGSLQFDDEAGEVEGSHKYTMTLVQQ